MQPNWGELYFDHLEKFFGAPLYVAGKFAESDLDPTIQFLAFDHVFSGCATFCSLGLSHFEDRVGMVAEIVSHVDVHHPRALPDYFDQVPYVLANSLFFVIQERMQLGRGVVISGIEKICSSFAEDTRKVAVYFTTPSDLPQDFSQVANDKTSGRMLMAMFITKAEHDYFQDRGAEEFESLLEAKQVDAYDLERASCV